MSTQNEPSEIWTGDRRYVPAELRDEDRERLAAIEGMAAGIGDQLAQLRADVDRLMPLADLLDELKSSESVGPLKLLGMLRGS